MTHTLQVDTTDHSSFYLMWVTGTLALTLTQPDGVVITPAYADAHPDVVTYTISPGSGETPPIARYAFTNTVPGLYTMTVAAGNVGNDGTNYGAFATLESNRVFSVMVSADLYQVGSTAIFTGMLQGPSGGITGANLRVLLTRFDGVTETLLFNGVGAGTYTSTYTVPDVPGYLQATFKASGNDGGTLFTRQVNEVLAIAPHGAQLVGVYADYAEDINGDNFSDVVALSIGVTATQVGTYTLSANMVAADQVVAHATKYTPLVTGTQTITLHFSGYDIFKSQISGPYTVTSVFLIDLGVGDLPADSADNAWMTAAYDWRDFGVEANFSASPLAGTTPLTVTFTNASQPSTTITAYLWDFGDGFTSTLTNPVHTYNANGSFTVSLSAWVGTRQHTITRTNYVIATQSQVFADGFESGDFSAWSATVTNTGRLNVTTGAAKFGSFGMRAYITDMSPMYVRDDTPNGERRYRARFYFNPNSISMASGNTHDIFVGRAFNADVFRIQFRYYGGNYQVRAQIVDNSLTSSSNTSWYTISNTWHSLEIDWKAALVPCCADMGYISLWIDGVLKETQSNVGNDTLQVDEVRLGPLAGIDSGTSGVEYFDAFVSRRDTYIGP